MCKDFLNGRCQHGGACRYSHDAGPEWVATAGAPARKSQPAPGATAGQRPQVAAACKERRERKETPAEAKRLQGTARKAAAASRGGFAALQGHASDESESGSSSGAESVADEAESGVGDRVSAPAVANAPLRACSAEGHQRMQANPEGVEAREPESPAKNETKKEKRARQKERKRLQEAQLEAAFGVRSLLR